VGSCETLCSLYHTLDCGRPQLLSSYMTLPNLLEVLLLLNASVGNGTVFDELKRKNPASSPINYDSLVKEITSGTRGEKLKGSFDFSLKH